MVTLCATPRSAIPATARRRRPLLPPRPAAASTPSVPVASAPSGDADAAPAVVRAPPGSHIYFAYGSNVGTKTMTGVRGVKPSASYPAILRDYRLVFNVPGLPYVEPGFASVKRVLPGASPDDDTTDQLARYEREVHGVAHVVTEEEWRVILRTESGYAREEVTLREFLPGVDAPARLIEATTLVYPDIATGGELLPSARYIDLLREGAAEWNLDEGWRRYLRDQVRSYDPTGDPMRTAGAAVAAASLAPLAVASAPLGLAAAARGALERVGEVRDPVAAMEAAAEAAVGDGFRAFAEVTWGVHDAFWAPVFGSGANNGDERGSRRGEDRR